MTQLFSGWPTVVIFLAFNLGGCSEVSEFPAPMSTTKRKGPPPPPPAALALDTPTIEESDFKVAEPDDLGPARLVEAAPPIAHTEPEDSAPEQPVIELRHPARTWTTTGGQFSGSLDRLNESLEVVIVVGTEERVVPFNQLSQKDRKFAIDAVAYEELFDTDDSEQGVKNAP